MANPVCSTLTLVTNATQFKQDAGVTPLQQKALLAYAMLLELKAIGGTDYTANLAQLKQDAMSLECGTTENERMAARVSIALTNAAAAGATVAATASALLAQIGRFSNEQEWMLDDINLLLTCKLGRHAPYPQ